MILDWKGGKGGGVRCKRGGGDREEAKEKQYDAFGGQESGF